MEEIPNIIEIKNEYTRINNLWLKLHYNTSIGLVIFAFIIECTLGMALYFSGGVELAIHKYVLKYIIAPFALNSVFIILGYLAMHFLKFSEKAKVFTISLLFVAICFVFYSVHRVFPSLYLIFTLPILLTVVYSNYILTTVTALISISAKIISELFVKWDPHATRAFSSDITFTDFMISICILCAFFAVCLIVIRFEREKNAASIQKEIERYKLKKRLHTDELTALFNRTALRKAFKDMEEDDSGNTYIFVMIDLDNFKILNDTLGHHKGDQCLQAFGRILKAACLDAAAFRFGGDEFCILFKNQTIDAVKKVCSEIQNDFKKFCAQITTHVPLTASFGIAPYIANMTATQLLKNTDLALYRSKTKKNTIFIHEDQP